MTFIIYFFDSNCNLSEGISQAQYLGKEQLFFADISITGVYTGTIHIADMDISRYDYGEVYGAWIAFADFIR